MLRAALLYWLDPIGELMSLPPRSREHRRKLAEIHRCLDRLTRDDWDELHPGARRRAFHRQFAYFVCVPVLYALMQVALASSLHRGFIRAHSVIQIFFLAAILACSVALFVDVQHELDSLRQHLLRSIEAFGRELQALPPEQRARIRALDEDPWRAYHECEAPPDPYVITCGCVDCREIFHTGPEGGREFPSCPRCGSETVVYAGPDVPLTAGMLEDLHKLFYEEI